MPSLPTAVSWMLSLRDPADTSGKTPARWSVAELAGLAEVPEDRAKAYLCRLGRVSAVIDCGEGWWVAGPRAAVRAWRRQAGNGREGGNSSEFRKAQAARKAIQERVMGGGTGGGEPLESVATDIADHPTAYQDVTGDNTVGLLTRGEVADALGVSLMTIHRLIKRGELQAYRITSRAVRIEAGEVERYMKQRVMAVKL